MIRISAQARRLRARKAGGRDDAPVAPPQGPAVDPPPAVRATAPPRARRRVRLSRRKALSSAAALGATAVLLGTLTRSEQARALPGDRIRPPGALPEPAFLSACVRCGLCVQDCPFDVLHLAGLDEPLPAGTPYFVARTEPCRMCEDIPCVVACPTGALTHALADIRRARMGVSDLTAPRRCLSFSGAAYCDSCYQACPVKGKAIRMQAGRTAGGGLFRPLVDPDHCTGCGLCESACVLDGVAAITVQANHQAQR